MVDQLLRGREACTSGRRRRALLEAAVAYARDHGAGVVEGYPVRTAGGKVSSAGLNTGTEGMFERSGFGVAAETTSGARTGTPRIVMRRERS